MKPYAIFPLIFFLVSGCVERIDLPLVVAGSHYVVNGLFTDELSIQTVELSRMSAGDESELTPVTGAEVFVTEDAATVYELHEQSAGVYQTDEFVRGQIGKSYQLTIRVEGKELRSIPAIMNSCGTIDSVYFEVQENIANVNDPFLPHDVFQILIDATGAGNKPDLLRWRWSSVHQVHTFPELNEKPLPVSGGLDPLVWVPDPLPCSGYIVGELYQLVKVDECKCCDCYIEDFSRNVVVSKPVTSNMTQFDKVQVAQVVVDKWLLVNDLYLEVEQLSVDEKVYDFWSLLRIQQSGTSDIFQPNVVKIKGNMFEAEGKEEVYGIFSVSSVKRKSIRINKNDYPKFIGVIDTLRSDCRSAYPGSTTKKPVYY